jgi:hypothetical protein
MCRNSHAKRHAEAPEPALSESNNYLPARPSAVSPSVIVSVGASRVRNPARHIECTELITKQQQFNATSTIGRVSSVRTVTGDEMNDGDTPSRDKGLSYSHHVCVSPRLLSKELSYSHHIWGSLRLLSKDLSNSHHIWGSPRRLSKDLSYSHHIWGSLRLLSKDLSYSHHIWGSLRRLSKDLSYSHHIWGSPRRLSKELSYSHHIWGSPRLLSKELSYSHHIWGSPRLLSKELSYSHHTRGSFSPLRRTVLQPGSGLSIETGISRLRSRNVYNFTVTISACIMKRLLFAADHVTCAKLFDAGLIGHTGSECGTRLG